MPVNDKTYKPILSLTVRAGEDLPAHRFVGFDGSLCANNAKALGVPEVNFAEGENASVVSVGTVIVESATELAPGDRVTSDSEGRAKIIEGEEEINGIVVQGSGEPGFATVLLVNA